jgi:hypothetical protein
MEASYCQAAQALVSEKFLFLGTIANELSNGTLELDGDPLANTQKVTAAIALMALTISFSSLFILGCAELTNVICLGLTNGAATSMGAFLVLSLAPALITVAKICAFIAMIATVIWLAEVVIETYTHP